MFVGRLHNMAAEFAGQFAPAALAGEIEQAM